MRDRISQAMKDAMKARDKPRLSALRMMLAALNDRELGIGAGALPQGGELSDQETVQVLQKLVKQRRDAIATYTEHGRRDLADKETAELAVIEEFLPQQMDEAEMRTAITGLIEEVGADSPKDIGKVMGPLKQKFAGRMDLGKASGLVKQLLA